MHPSKANHNLRRVSAYVPTRADKQKFKEQAAKVDLPGSELISAFVLYINDLPKTKLRALHEALLSHVDLP